MVNKCDDFEPLIALSVTDDLSAEEQAGVDMHVENCEACSRAFSAHSQIQHSLSALAEPFDEPGPVLDITESRYSFVSRKGQFGMVALAAAVLVFVAGMTLFRPSGNAPESTIASTTNTTTEVLRASNESEQIDSIIERPVVRLIKSANDSDTGIVSTIYTDNPDIVIAWISD